jgi:hypothetical protein
VLFAAFHDRVAVHTVVDGLVVVDEQRLVEQEAPRGATA